MSSRARQQRHQEMTRQAILDAALALARQDGWSALTLRKIAERIEYTHAALYTYFATKDDLLLAILRQGFGDLLMALHAARSQGQTPQAAFMATVLAYWDFAWDHPEVYQVMYGLDGIAFGVAQTTVEGEAIGEEVAAALRPLFAQQQLAASGVAQQVIQLWSTVHGMIALIMSGRIGGGRADNLPLVLASIRDLLRGWGIVVATTADEPSPHKK